MRLQDNGDSVALWLSPRDTERWATKAGAHWPCSQLRGRRVFASFDRHGLNDMSLDSGRGEQDCDANEFNALTSDSLAAKLPEDHPCYFVTVGQFRDHCGDPNADDHPDTPAA
jgi:hypothetical protein